MNIQKFRQMGISTSRLDSWICRKKFWYIINNWYNPNSNSNKNTYFGNLGHYLLENCLQNEKTEYSYDILLSKCREYDSKNSKNLFNLEPSDLELDKGLAISVITEFLNLWYSEGKNMLSNLQKNFSIIKNELNLKRIHYLNSRFNLKIDLTLQNRKNKKIWLCDYKFKSRFDDSILLKKLSFDQQLYLYSGCFEQAYKNQIPVEGLYQIIIRKPQLRKTKKDKDLMIFIERVTEDIKNRPEHYFFPLSILIDQNQKEIFESEMKQKMNEIYKTLQLGEKAFYKNTAVCDTPYTCDFLDACSTGNMDLFLKYF